MHTCLKVAENRVGVKLRTRFEDNLLLYYYSSRLCSFEDGITVLQPKTASLYRSWLPYLVIKRQ